MKKKCYIQTCNISRCVSFTCLTIVLLVLATGGTECFAIEVSAMSVRLTWCLALADYFHKINEYAYISLKHGNVVHEFPVNLWAMEFTIQDLKINTEYTLKLEVEIYNGIGTPPLYQRLLVERFRTSNNRKLKIYLQASNRLV